MIDLINRDFILKYKAEILLAGILVVSAFLNIWNIWNQGLTNTFYAAAVKSTLVNPAAGFFNSFDPAGFVTVDKPPVGLWVQAAFAAVLGFKGWVLVLPQALAGIGSVALIYFIVARPFGKPAGLVAALALAVTPILVAVSRNGTMDTQLIFVLLLAVWAVLRATRERSLSWLLVSVCLIGIGFNIKMIQAFVVVPAVLVIYFLGTTDFSFRKRALHLGIAVLVLLAVSLSWAVAVDMVPANERPYIGGSGDNTVLGLIINYNGLERLGLENRGMPGMADGTRDQRTGAIREDEPQTGSGARAAGVNPYEDQGAAQGGAAGGMANGEGTPGITRFFGETLAGQFSWLLPLALIGLLAWVRRPASLTLKGFEDVGIAGEQGLTLIAMLLWLVPGLLFFSFTTAFGHTYYIATIAPPLAALVGIGAVAMYREYLTEGWKGWILIGAVLITGLLQALFLSYDAAWSGLLIPFVLFGTIVCTGILASLKVRKNAVSHNGQKYIAVIALGLLFVAPFVWSCTPLIYGSNQGVAGPPAARIGGGSGYGTDRGLGTGNIPGTNAGRLTQDFSGRERLSGAGNASYASGYASGRGAFSLTGTGNTSDTRLVDYLLSHTTNETWILAVPSSQTGANLIIETGKPVMSIGGFSGSDRILNITSLETLIQEGKVRYFLTSGSAGVGGGMNAGNSGIFSWVSSHCTAVDLSSGNETGMNTTGIAGAGSQTSGSLYDCAGAAGSG
ncbi:MAG: glycosyltransferase family 39 protein [Methanoregula sp.]|uniref:glycosyltransferase family 39 protein n=1 Tax=Methanoregula sp. TaxID=2052170 RepID=UPI003C774C0D